ncbi:MAG TPA: 2Fe-2S iron-sulfur cluster-binding protein [Polyangiaceae bacterium]|jgi:2Fe-2S ferredoxin|nr:2Fe-2S iron-sulfur cluster-binding protein [Polyangiaceae bacterium]
MATIEFLGYGISVEVPAGTSILQAAKRSGAPEGDACGGVCACSTCHVYVEKGAECLTPAEEGEEDILDKAFDVKLTSRLGCQAKVKADGQIAVRISKESLSAYYNEHPDVERPAR